jgi:hypothetical protein
MEVAWGLTRKSMAMYILAFIVFAALWEPIESGYSDLLIDFDFQQGLPHDDASFEEMALLSTVCSNILSK